MNHCATFWHLYARLVSACHQLTPRDGDAETCAAIATAEVEKPERRSAVERLQDHVKACATCRLPGIPRYLPAVSTTVPLDVNMDWVK